MSLTVLGARWPAFIPEVSSRRMDLNEMLAERVSHFLALG
jgi:hypothetical protein